MSKAITYNKTPVVCRGEALSEVWWQGRQWAVTAYGLERRDGTYFIEAKRLLEDLRGEPPYSWTEHIGRKLYAGGLLPARRNGLVHGPRPLADRHQPSDDVLRPHMLGADELGALVQLLARVA